MKRLFWCSVVVAVAAAGSVYLASRHVERPRAVVIGQALMRLGGEEAASNGTASDEVKPPEPVPVGSLPPVQPEMPEKGEAAAASPAEVVARAEGLPGQIIINDPMNLPAATEKAPAFNTDFLPVSLTTSAPAKMPYCEEAEVSTRRMPYADDGDCGEEEAEVWQMLRQAAKEANEEAAKEMPPEPMDPEEVCPEEQAGYHHHQHEQVCPYTGHSYPLPKVCPPAPEPEKVKVPKMEEAGEEQEPLPHTQLDTMEFRPSDAGFQHFIPGPF